MFRMRGAEQAGDCETRKLIRKIQKRGLKCWKELVCEASSSVKVNVRFFVDDVAFDRAMLRAL